MQRFLTIMILGLLSLTPAAFCEDAVSVADTGSQQTVSAADAVKFTLAQIAGENANGAEWEAGAALFRLGADALPSLESSLANATPSQTLTICYALLRLGEQNQATRAVEALIINDKLPLETRVNAAALLGSYGGNYASARLRMLLANTPPLPELLRVEMAKSLWKLTHGATAHEILQEIMNTGNDRRARAESILALGRFGRFTDAQPQLELLATQPGRYGEEARTIIDQNHKLEGRIRRDDFPARLIQELVFKVRQLYAPDDTDPDEAEQLKPEHLASVAADAMLQSIDPFSSYLDEQDFRDLAEQMRADYGGIGAWVGLRSGRFTILTPMYGQPAFKAGIRSMDVVEQVDGTDITGMPLNKVVQMLKGKPKSKVSLAIIRKGWDEPKTFEVIRDLIEVPTLNAQMLPGGIGYIRLNGFNEDPRLDTSTSKALHTALLDFEKRGLTGLLIDLRNNPGGLLPEAVHVAEQFVDSGSKIVSSKGKAMPEQSYFSTISGKPTYTGPMVVLVNQGSASASEIVAGALRDLGRATLVGQKTYGKGSVQQLIPVDLTGGTTRMKLTIAKYYLPKGECIHKKGIEPHVKIEDASIAASEVEARWTLRDNHELIDWVEKMFPNNEKKFRDLLEFDSYNPESYPDFDQLLKQMQDKYPKLKITPDILRKELRVGILSFLKDRRGEDENIVDIQESETLQQALVVLGQKMKDGKLPNLPVYNAFRDKYTPNGPVEAVALENNADTEKNKPQN